MSFNEKDLKRLREIINEADFEGFETDAFEALAMLDEQELENFKRMSSIERKSYLKQRIASKRDLMKDVAIRYQNKNLPTPAAANIKATFDLSIMVMTSQNDGGFGSRLVQIPIFGYNQMHDYSGYLEKMTNFVAAWNIFDGNYRSLNEVFGAFILRTSAQPYNFYMLRCPQTSYYGVLSSLASKGFKISGMRFTEVLDQNGQILNATNIYVRRKTIFGAESRDQIALSSFVYSGQYQRNIVDVPLDIFVDEFTVLVLETTHPQIQLSSPNVFQELIRITFFVV